MYLWKIGPCVYAVCTLKFWLLVAVCGPCAAEMSADSIPELCDIFFCIVTHSNHYQHNGFWNFQPITFKSRSSWDWPFWEACSTMPNARCFSPFPFGKCLIWRGRLSLPLPPRSLFGRPFLSFLLLFFYVLPLKNREPLYLSEHRRTLFFTDERIAKDFTLHCNWFFNYNRILW